jgi:hypothetical protein
MYTHTPELAMREKFGFCFSKEREQCVILLKYYLKRMLAFLASVSQNWAI